MRVLVAARLSRKIDETDDDTSRGSQTGIESQDAELLSWATREGHEIIHVAADFKSGTSHPWNRKNLRPWVTEPDKIAQYDAVVAYRFDRLSRGDDRSTSMIEEWAYQNGKVLLTEDGLRFPCEGTDGIRWDVIKRIAHEEWLKSSERYLRMQRYLRGAGYLVGRGPYGFRIVADGKHKTLVPDPVEAQVINDAATWYLEGMSLQDICDKLNEAGRLPRPMRNKKPPWWTVNTLSGVLRNETIVGRRKDAAGKTILKVEPILTRDIWERVIARMDARALRKGLSQSKTPALLTSIIMCTNCDKPMYRTGTGYYCRVKGCTSFILLRVADGIVHEAMSADHNRDTIETLIPGSGHDAEIAEVKRDIAEAADAEDWDRQTDLRAELDRLRALPATPTHVERRESDQTVAEMWATMPDDTARRAYLLERGISIYYGSDERGWFLTALVHQVDRATALMWQWRPSELMDPNAVDPNTPDEWPEAMADAR